MFTWLHPISFVQVKLFYDGDLQYGYDNKMNTQLIKIVFCPSIILDTWPILVDHPTKTKL